MPEHRFVLRDIDIPDIEGMARYRSRGGYEGARRVLTGMTPAQVLAEVDASGLQGRGGGWTRVADKWRLMPPHAPPSDAAGASRYLVVNGYESEPGLFRDRKLMERLPHRLIEGVIIAAYTLGAQVAYICVRADMVRVVRVLEEALAEARELGWLGSDIRGTGFSLDIHIHAGAGAHIAGEETAMLSLLEGRRAEPRPRSLLPTHQLLFGQPALVHNAGTLAYLPAILAQGAAIFRQIGTRRHPGTCVFCVSGHVQRPGLYELEIGSATLRELVEEFAGGIAAGRALKGVLPGGISSRVLTPEQLDVSLSPHELGAQAAVSFNGAVIVMDDSTCMVRAAVNAMEFYAGESCGKCTPCREGAPWLLELLRRVESGQATAEDIDTIKGVSAQVAPEIGSSPAMCGFGPAFASAVQGFLSAYTDEFEEHIEAGACPIEEIGGVRVPESVHIRF